ncbi:MAG TPA: alcohol dehydrogenase catalytic domain-containing protein [Candidatus Binatus sp.]|nr:alcohol dehydrogenase catalytic domain-containing protein [Candidatus Binatus sp.]
MRAAVYTGERTIAVEERETPRPGPGQVLIAVDYCGICGTDLHAVFDGWGRTGAILGHEYSGRIAALGPGVGGWSVGEPVTAEPGLVCGRCRFCAGGRPSLCTEYLAALLRGDWPGAFAERVLVDARQLHRIPPGLDARAAALTEPLAVALHAIGRSGVREGERALVTGAGPLGCLHVAALKAMGVAEVAVSEPSPARRAAAIGAGADQALAPEELVVPPPFADVEHPFDVVLECSGKPAAFAAGLAQLRPGGTLVIVGTGLVPPELEHNRVLLKELVVTGALNYDASGFEDALALLASGRLPLDALIARDDVPLADIMPAMERLAAGTAAAKLLVVPR